MNKRFDVFLSHNSRDKPAVRELAEALRARGLKVWLDEWELVPGRPWQEALEEVIETTGSSAVLVGKDGLGPWQDAEMRGCLSEFVRRKLPVIPVLLPGALEMPKLPIFLVRFTWIDLGGGLTEEGLDRLQWGITGEKPNRSKPPAIPTAAPEAAAVAAGFAKPVLLDKPIELKKSLQTSPTIRVQVTLAMEFSSYDQRVGRLLKRALAEFLEISPEEVTICSVEEGSVKLIVELPVAAAKRLLEAGESGLIPLEGYLDSLGEIRVSAITAASKLPLVAPLVALQFGWQEGILLRDLGFPRAAETALLRVRQGFMERELLYEVALVSLDLSAVYLQLGKVEKLHEAVAEMVPIFKSLGVDREVLAALLQLQQANQQRHEGLELIRFLSSRVRALQQ